MARQAGRGKTEMIDDQKPMTNQIPMFQGFREHFNIYTEATEAQRTTETTRRKHMRIERFVSWERDF
jgi:hypothetical protein